MSSSWLGLDIGKKRIGVAFAGNGLSIARAMPTLENNEIFWDHLQELVKEKTINQIVIGLPRSLNGEETDQTKYVRNFASLVKQKTSVNIVFQDEALSSKIAEESLQNAGKNPKSADVDSLAAMTILQDFLNQGGKA
jgi:putative holliday junction resolvase